MRSRRRHTPSARVHCGITSACAEQTDPCPSARWPCRDHLRVCGADTKVVEPSDSRVGSPPRVRSRLAGTATAGTRLGITSACAEQTCSPCCAMTATGDHLRVCGADFDASARSRTVMGSPPRVRSRRESEVTRGTGRGITSACAEQTRWASSSATRRRDHLRVCGADQDLTADALHTAGSPPRVRSRPERLGNARRTRRITSACAEQTLVAQEENTVQRDHLRVCGADATAALTNALRAGSPPRVRSRPVRRKHWPDSHRITSACAEQTVPETAYADPYRDHLRVCGADVTGVLQRCARLGSPPRVRSRRALCLNAVASRGITSACAEQTFACSCLTLTEEDHLRVCGADTIPLVDSQSRRRITSACAEQTRPSRTVPVAERDHLRVCGADSSVTIRL